MVAWIKTTAANRLRGSRASNQRIGTVGIPSWRPTALAVLISTRRPPPPYRPGPMMHLRRHGWVGQHLGQVRRASAFGPRRPSVPGGRGGAGSLSAASGSRLQDHCCRRRPVRGRQPAVCLQRQLRGPVGQPLVRASTLAVAFRESQSRQEGQGDGVGLSARRAPPN